MAEGEVNFLARGTKLGPTILQTHFLVVTAINETLDLQHKKASSGIFLSNVLSHLLSDNIMI